MKIAIVSDLHLEMLDDDSMIVQKIITESDGCDLLVLAGDIDAVKPCRDELIEKFQRHIRTFFILGNHDYYGSEWYDDFRDDGDVVGGCLWTNFDKRNPAVESSAKRYINDYRHIKNWTIDKTVAAFEDHKAKIFNSPAKIVVTHFPPTWDMISPKYFGDPLNSYFANTMEFDIMASDKKLWICGHTHYNNDVQIGQCRIVSNCLGYRGEIFKTVDDYKLKIVDVDL